MYIRIYHITPCIFEHTTSPPVFSNMTANRIYKLRCDANSHTNQNANLCPYPILPTAMPTTAHIRFYMVRAAGGITELVYSILHGPKSCNIEYGQWLALELVKSDMSRGWHGGWWWCGCWCHKWVVYSILHIRNHINLNISGILCIFEVAHFLVVISNLSFAHKFFRVNSILHGNDFV